jgi:hypothetical protein
MTRVVTGAGALAALRPGGEAPGHREESPGRRFGRSDIPDDDGTLLRKGVPGRWWAGVHTGIWVAISRVVAGVLIAHALLVLFPGAVIHSRLSLLSDGTWLGAFDRWDARYYTTIALHGYPAHGPDVRAFFPGYPIVVRLASVVTGGFLGVARTASLVSMVAFVLSAGLLWRLVGRHLGPRVALVSTTLFCWFPTSVFFLAPYSEALFALEILMVATLVGKERWWWAAVVAGYATATSPEAVVLVAALAATALAARRGLARSIGYAAIGSAGGAAYVSYLGVRFDQPFAFIDVQSDFHRVTSAPFAGVIENVGAIHHALAGRSPALLGIPNLSAAALWHNIAWMWSVDDVAIVLAVCALVALVAAAVRDRRYACPDRDAVPRSPVLWIYVLAGITLLVASTVVHGPGGPVSTESSARLVSVAFPLYPGLALLMRRWQAPVAIGLGLCVGAALITQTLFTLGYWVT